jgi:hypothetical protein
VGTIKLLAPIDYVHKVFSLKWIALAIANKRLARDREDSGDIPKYYKAKEK